MRFVVLGAGAVGGTVGGLLADAGYDVVLVARGPHADAMRRSGLRLATPNRPLRPPVEVVSDIASLVLGSDDVVLLTTKTQDTAAALDPLAGMDVAGRAAVDVLPVVCVQNGVANEPIAARRFAHVYGVVVMMPAVLLEPGRIEAQGAPYSGLLDVGRWPSGVDDLAEGVAAAFAKSNMVSRAVPDVMRWKYAKLLRNLGNAVEALAGNDLDDAARAVATDLEHRLRDEAEASLRAAGIAWVDDDEWHARRRDQVQHATVEGRARSGGSSWQSLARGLGSIEADYLNGEIVLLGRRHGVATPANAGVQRLANAAARAARPPGSMTPQEIVKGIAGG